MWLSNNPTCRKRDTEEETSVYIVCECEVLASLRHTHLGSFFLDPEDTRKLSIGAGTSLKEQGSSNLMWNMGHKGPVLRPRLIGPGRVRTQILFNSIQFNSIQTFVVNLLGGQDLLPLHFSSPSSQIYGVRLSENIECAGLMVVPSLDTCEFLGVGHQT